MFDLSDLSPAIANLESLFAVAATPEIGQKFLRFQLCPESTALLPVDGIAAVISIAVAEILPVPPMPGCVLGIYNWQGEMLWLVDLVHQVGFPSTLRRGNLSTTVMAIVVQVDGQSLGLVVPQVYDIESHDPQQLQPASTALFPQKLLPFVQGYLTCDRSTVLDVAAILQDPLLQIHPLNAIH